MKVCIDVTPIEKYLTGVGFYVLKLALTLQSLQISSSFQMGIAYQPRFFDWLRRRKYFPAPISQHLNKFSSCEYVDIPVRISNLFSKYSPDFLSYYLSHKDSPDILHGTNYSVWPWPNCRKVVSVYDLSFMRYPEYSNSVSRLYVEQIRRCLEYVDLILTISHSTKQDIAHYLDISPDKIFVTPLASRYECAEANNNPISSEDPELSILKKISPKPYFLFTGTLEPRKNIPMLIRAFSALKSKYKVDHQLLLVGRKGWKYEPVFKAIEDSICADEIHYLNYLSNQALMHLYQQAEAFIYPSYFEGFGLPVLEAMSLGCPVITSNTSSLPEVAGNAAILTSPTEMDELIDAMHKNIDSQGKRQTLISLGYKQASKFSWQNTAYETLAAYRSIL